MVAVVSKILRCPLRKPTPVSVDCAWYQESKADVEDWFQDQEHVWVAPVTT